MTSSDEITPDLLGPDAVGVGPWAGAWPDDPRYDPDLLRDGDRRNVADHFRYWSVEAIVADLDTRRHPFHIAIENWAHDLNIGSVVRTANAFNAAGVHIVGRRRWNRRGAMVTDRYLHVHHHQDAAHLVTWASSAGWSPTSSPSSSTAASSAGPSPGSSSSASSSTAVSSAGVSPGGLAVIGVDNLPGSVPLETFALPRECVLVFGQEGPGLSPASREACSAILSIAQYGSTRSINASAAAAIAMHTWIRQHASDPADAHSNHRENRREAAERWFE